MVGMGAEKSGHLCLGSSAHTWVKRRKAACLLGPGPTPDPSYSRGRAGRCRPRLTLHCPQPEPAHTPPCSLDHPPGARPTLGASSLVTSPNPASLILGPPGPLCPPVPPLAGGLGTGSWWPGSISPAAAQTTATQALAQLLDTNLSTATNPCLQTTSFKPLHRTRKRGSRRGSDLPKATQDGGGRRGQGRAGGTAVSQSPAWAGDVTGEGKENWGGGSIELRPGPPAGRAGPGARKGPGGGSPRTPKRLRDPACARPARPGYPSRAPDGDLGVSVRGGARASPSAVPGA